MTDTSFANAPCRANFAAVPRRREQVATWHPGDGDLTIGPAHDVQTLRLEDADRTLAEIAALIQPDEGSPPPRVLPGEIAVTGTAGQLRLGAETLSFRGLERIVIGGYSAYRR